MFSPCPVCKAPQHIADNPSEFDGLQCGDINNCICGAVMRYTEHGLVLFSDSDISALSECEHESVLFFRGMFTDLER